MTYRITASNGSHRVQIERDSSLTLDRICRKLRLHGYQEINIDVVWKGGE